jgi:hypothetical protein
VLPHKAGFNVSNALVKIRQAEKFAAKQKLTLNFCFLPPSAMTVMPRFFPVMDVKSHGSDE